MWHTSRILAVTYTIGWLIVVVISLLAHFLLGFGQTVIGLLVVPGFAGVMLGLLMIVFPRRLSQLNREAIWGTLEVGSFRHRVYFHPVAYVFRGLSCIFIGASLIIGGLVFGFGLGL